MGCGGETKMVIYVVVCSETLKLYIGQHKHENRLKQYLASKFWDAHQATTPRSHLYNAMRKHPRETWSIWPLVVGIETRAELNALEQHFIRVLKTQHDDIGYNICEGGEGFTGPHTERWRQETLARVRDYWAKPESRKQRGEVMRDRWKNPEFRQMMTERSKGNKYNLGRVQSEEEKRQRSLAGKGRQFSPEHRAKLRAAWIQRRQKVKAE
jgi:hypothetical protein